MTNIVKKRQDFYYRKAKFEGYRSRASYKLLQIQKRYRIVHSGDIIVDLGAAPGGWLQVIRQLDATAIAVDLQQIAPLEGVTSIRSDITAPDIVIKKIQELVGEVNVVVSDAAPNLSGVWSLDHARSIDLSNSALKIALGVLKTGGSFVVKVFQGDLFDSFTREVRAHFSFVKSFNPRASRKQSAEIYVVAKHYLNNNGT
jgi:23S rRNA (uridine2552-2'-O)-methyltransferase